MMKMLRKTTLFGCLGLALLVSCLVHAQSIPSEPDPKDPNQPRLRRFENGDVMLGSVRLNREERTLSFPAVVELRNGPVEVLVSAPHGRLHEAVLKADVNALHLQVMLYLLGLENGARLPGGEVDQGDLVDIDLEWKDDGGEWRRKPVEWFLHDRRKDGVAERVGWVFVGSSASAGVLLAETEGNLVLTWSQGETVLDTADPEGDDDTLFTVHTEHLDAIPVDAEIRVVVVPR